MVDIFKLFVWVTFPTEMLEEVSHVFVVCLKALFGVATKTSAVIHFNKLATVLDGTMQCMIQHCPRKVGYYVCHCFLDMLFVSFNVYYPSARNNSEYFTQLIVQFQDAISMFDIVTLAQ